MVYVISSFWGKVLFKKMGFRARCKLFHVTL